MRYGPLGIILICAFLVLLLPAKAFAHSSVLTEIPMPNSILASSPPVIKLTFNERLEKELFSIKVMDSQGKSVTSAKTQMSLTQRELNLTLPPLNDGVYTVDYKVISADGHPIEADYTFTIGNASRASSGINGTDANSESNLSSNSKHFNTLLYLGRFLFYASLLGLCGWIFWTLAYRPIAQDLVNFNRKITLVLQIGFLFSLLLMIFTQLQAIADQWSFTTVKSVLLGTTLGYSWFASLGLSIIGFIFLSRSRIFDGLWVVLLLTAKVGNGHAMSFENHIGMAALNVVHLFAAAIWVGGLLYIIAHWRKFHDYTIKFLPQFSKYALLSMLLLTVSGTLYTLIILPKIEYLFETQWGILLCTKIGLMLLVFAVGGMLRYYMKRKKSISIKQLVRIDISLMLLILLIVSIFTYLNPLPDNLALQKQAMESQSNHEMMLK
ncbi:hypothetical protein EHS13_14175 [Paenibacillus psychroresistens]|uniref:Copper resistance protein CopC n=1 Tax=Paenibacillus psychroresistens TaxID=1778678 RepID=A0A6B8RIQ0_9BACL|nr:copper resistance protein CopC [Paenibacillus psychroresistens]QGQ95939.1 hypothetical protein EHS13_14175 [Paenibacillus psychroresistens]